MHPIMWAHHFGQYSQQYHHVVRHGYALRGRILHGRVGRVLHGRFGDVLRGRVLGGQFGRFGRILGR